MKNKFVASVLLFSWIVILSQAAYGATDKITLLQSFPFNVGPLDELQCNLISDGSALYGTSTYGGDESYGTAFKWSLDSSELSILHSFGYQDPDGMWPAFGLGSDGAALYGITGMGGTANFGTLYKVNKDGTGFSVLHNFSLAAGDVFSCSGPVVVGSTLYGIAAQGGVGGGGAIYKIATDGSGFSLLHSLAGADGQLPGCVPLVSGSTIFGTASRGGSKGGGTIYSMNVDDGSFTVLHAFEGGADGQQPAGRLTLSGSTIYGITGQTRETGTIYKIDTDGSGYQVLATLPEGLSPSIGGLTLVGNELYGTTVQGGDYNYGTVFKIRTDGTGFTILDSFNGDNGAGPFGGMVQVGSKLYGVTSGWSEPAMVTLGSIYCVEVPEPSTLALLLTAALGGLLWRRRSR